MRKFIGLLSCLFIISISVAQKDAALQIKTKGSIHYVEKTNLHKHMTGERAQYKSMVPEFREVDMILAFNEDAAIYGDRTQITGEEEVITDENRRQVMFKAMAPKNTYFLDRKKGKEIQNREFMSRNFLIEDAKDDSKWKITPFQEDIKGYICQEATMTTEDSTEVKAWFTTQIPIPLGPQGYNSLPGMILKVDINDGDMIIEAKNIQLGELNEDWITAPKKGKKVTQEEFKAIVKEKMEEMREMYGGSGRGPHIRVQTR